MLHSIRFKLSAILFITTSIALCAAGYANYSLSKQKLTGQLEENMLSAVSDTAGRLADFLNIRMAKVQTVSRTEVMRGGALEEQLAYLNEEIKSDARYLRFAGVADRFGTLRLSSGERHNIADEPAYRMALAGLPAISDPFIGRGQQAYIVTFMAPVKDANDRVTHVISFAVDAQTMFDDTLMPVGDARDRTISLLNRSTDVLYHSDSSRILQFNYAEAYPDLADTFRRIGESGRGIVDLAVAGEELKGFHAEVQGTGWRLLLTIDKGALYAPQRSLFGTTLGVIALTELALFLLVYFALDQLIIQRVRAVSSVTERVARGNFTLRPIVDTSRDELGQLADSVNDMTRNLRGMFEPFETFVRRNQYAMIVTDADYRVTLFNARAEEMLGYTADEVVQRVSPELWLDPHELRERAAAASRELGETTGEGADAFFAKPLRGLPADPEWTWISRSGARIPVDANVSVMAHPDGSVKGFVIMARDISAYKETERTRNRLLSIIDKAHDFIATFDGEGRMISINEAGVRMLGIPRTEDGIGRITDYMAGRHAGLFPEALRTAEAEGFWEDEVAYMTFDGRRIITSQVIVAHPQPEGGSAFYSTIVRDITEHKRIEWELEEANRSKSMFLARMSHEIRTPLGGIIGLAHLMQRTQLTIAQQDYLQKMQVSSRSLLQIINDILDFSKIEADKMSIEPVPFSLEETVQRLCETVSVLLGHKPLDVIVDVDEDVPTALVGDAMRLTQILLNLMSNAIKFTEQGLIKLSIAVTERSGELTRLKFTVADTGIGMSADQLQSLFHPFVQIDESTSRKYGGTGLGLVITKHLVERMGGMLEVASFPGAGTEFGFELTFPVGPANEAPPALPPLGIVLAEDSPDMRDHLRGLIGGMATPAAAFGSWREAAARLAEAAAETDVLMLDMEAEDMYGEETWFHMKQIADRQGLATVLFTSLNGRDAIEQLSDEWKPDAVLIKPVCRRNLYQALKGLEEKRRAAALSLPAPAAEERRIAGKGEAAPLIMVVEDNPINRIVTRQLLEAEGLNVALAFDGFEALAQLERKPVDLVLMDLHMPGIDGIETTVRIRRRESGERVPIIALTADTTEERRQACFAAGMDGVLTKPIEPQVLIEALARWLPGRYAAGTDAAAVATKAEAAAGRESGAPAAGPTAAAAEPAALALPAGWRDAIDVATALRLLDGRQALLLDMLAAFRAQYGGAADELRLLMERGEWATARRLAHSLRGTAGNLAAEEVQSSAAALEDALARGKHAEASGPLLARLREALRPFREGAQREQA